MKKKICYAIKGFAFCGLLLFMALAGGADMQTSTDMFVTQMTIAIVGFLVMAAVMAISTIIGGEEDEEF